MRILGHRFCLATEADAVRGYAELLERLGLPETDQGDGEDFGAIFRTGRNSWIELAAAAAGEPGTVTLQIVVDDADAFAERARGQGVEAEGPYDCHGERTYRLKVPGPVPISVHSVFIRRAE